MKRIAIICEWAGVIHRGGESSAIELGNYLSQSFEVDMYTRAKSIEGFMGNVVTVNYNESKLLKKYTIFYEKAIWLQKLIWCSRYTSIFYPSSIESFSFGKIAFHELKKRGNYDLLYPITGPGCHWLAKSYCKKIGIPFIASGGGGIGPGEWWNIKSKPDCYVCISTEQYKWANSYTPKLTLIPNGTYVADYNVLLDKDKFIINKGHKLVICVGNLDTSFKRHQLAIEAVSKLDNVDLLILGYGEAKEEFEELGEKLMPGRLKIFGVPHTEIAYYYKSADLFTLASLKEPFGMVYIEAMAAGLPCVTTDDETRREIIGDAGFVCNVENAEDYAKTIRRALDTDWDNHPYERACCYDYSVIGAKYNEMIEKLILYKKYCWV